MKEKILCLIPARGGSKRLPRKNILPLKGKPMICYTIDAALKSELFEDVYVSTEDKEIAKISNECGAKVIIRPQELAGDLVSVVDVCLHAIEFLKSECREYTLLCVLLPTAPLRTSRDIVKALEIFLTHGEASFLMAVTNYFYDPFQALKEEDGYLIPVFPEYLKKKRQELPRVYVDNGSIYIAKIEEFLKYKTFYGPKMIKYYMPFDRSIDVDTEVEFRLAEYFLERMVEK
jgi:CMP-N-acetylneuraminic acid synthetase